MVLEREPPPQALEGADSLVGDRDADRRVRYVGPHADVRCFGVVDRVVHEPADRVRQDCVRLPAPIDVLRVEPRFDIARRVVLLEAVAVG